jgi:hypothetical protein
VVASPDENAIITTNPEEVLRRRSAGPLKAVTAIQTPAAKNPVPQTFQQRQRAILSTAATDRTAREAQATKPSDQSQTTGEKIEDNDLQKKFIDHHTTTESTDKQSQENVVENKKSETTPTTPRKNFLRYSTDDYVPPKEL